MFAVTTGIDWQARGACLDEHPEVMFPEPHDSDGIDAAVAVCGRCPVRAECLAWAWETNQRFGVWGGMPEEERHRRKRAHQRREARRRAREVVAA